MGGGAGEGGRIYVLRAFAVRLLIKRAPGAVHACTTPQALLCAEKNGVTVVVDGVFVFKRDVAFDGVAFDARGLLSVTVS